MQDEQEALAQAVAALRVVEQSGGLLAQADVARRYGVARRRAHSWVRTAAFPTPRCRIASRDVWLTVEVDEWVARTHPSLSPGREASTT